MHIACMILKLHPEVHMLKTIKFNFFVSDITCMHGIRWNSKADKTQIHGQIYYKFVGKLNYMDKFITNSNTWANS